MSNVQIIAELPDEWDNDTPLDSTMISRVEIELSTNNGGDWNPLADIIPPSLSVDVQDLPDGGLVLFRGSVFALGQKSPALIEPFSFSAPKGLKSLTITLT